MSRDKCRYADKYKAIRAPKCGCRVCREKWDNRPENFVVECRLPLPKPQRDFVKCTIGSKR